MNREPLPSVAIIGGGLSGAAVAYHLAERRAAATITVFEPRPTLGAGLAYGSTDPSHRINVPAAKMSLIPGDDAHFTEWIARTDAVADDPGARADDGELYVRRIVFGRYVYEHVKPWISAGRISHIKDWVQSVERRGGHWSIETRSGERFSADIVVLATTHPPPEVPRVLDDALKGSARLIADATKDQALQGIDPLARIAIVGTGLTMADVVASLDRRGHRGRIVAISRHGLLSRGHASRPYEPFGAFVRVPPFSTLELLQKVRGTIKEAEAIGLPWQAVIDRVRAEAGLFWPTMPIEERSRIVRHLRAYWDVHRFRIAPQIENVLKRRISEGSLTVHAASLSGAEAVHDHILLHLYPRGSMRPFRLQSDYVVITTGPAHGRIVESEPHLASLAHAGWIRRNSLGLGILCDLRGRAVSGSGDTIESLLIAGPLARGTFGELMGLPQVTNYAQSIAGEVLNTLEDKHPFGEAVSKPTAETH